MTTSPLHFCPEPPAWELRWDEITQEYEWIARMQGVSQSPEHHAEGDVYTHVRMVCEELIADSEWQALEPEAREELFAATLLHDIAKPACWRIDDDGNITTRGHSGKGELMAREILWRAGVPRQRRERICALVLHHMLPFFLLGSDDSEREALAVAEKVSWEQLTMHARADGRGRISDGRDATLEQVELAREYARERGCGSAPYPFENDHARFLYLRGERKLPTDPAWEDPKCTATVMSGLPGAGKDTWIRENRAGMPVVSLDTIRERLGVGPTDNQGTVIQTAREAAREQLRAGRDFVWNATNVTRQMRGLPIGLFAQYGARVEIVSVETTPAELLRRNQARADSVPLDVLDNLIAKWEVPDTTEAHAVHYYES